MERERDFGSVLVSSVVATSDSRGCDPREKNESCVLKERKAEEKVRLERTKKGKERKRRRKEGRKKGRRKRRRNDCKRSAMKSDRYDRSVFPSGKDTVVSRNG